MRARRCIVEVVLAEHSGVFGLLEELGYGILVTLSGASYTGTSSQTETTYAIHEPKDRRLGFPE